MFSLVLFANIKNRFIGEGGRLIFDIADVYIYMVMTT